MVDESWFPSACWPFSHSYAYTTRWNNVGTSFLNHAGCFLQKQILNSNNEREREREQMLLEHQWCTHVRPWSNSCKRMHVGSRQGHACVANWTILPICSGNVTSTGQIGSCPCAVSSGFRLTRWMPNQHWCRSLALQSVAGTVRVHCYELLL